MVSKEQPVDGGKRSANEKDAEPFDVVIIGAGIHGLSLAKTYKTADPSASILILEKGTTVGGVWAKGRLYPGLKTNNHFGSFEYSDYPMSSEGYGEDDHIPGHVVHNYLQGYAEHFDLLRHVRFRCNVESAQDEGEDGWLLTVRDENDAANQERIIQAAKLVIATGITSEPFMPTMEGRDTFSAPIYHSSEFAKASDGLGPYQRVTVLSGAKFSWDIAFAYASAGREVDWVIRSSGHGPCWMAPNRLTPLKIIPEFLVQTRLIAWLSPCIWGGADGYSWIRWFLHQTWLGRKIVDGFFHMMEHAVFEHNNYDAHPETAKLKPWDGIFFVGTNRGLLNYDQDFFQLVREGKIRIHIADITRLSKQKVHLSDGTVLDSDTLICGTGWKDAPPINFITDKDLGLPGLSTPAAAKHVNAAKKEIWLKTPKVAQQPPERKTIKPMMDKTSLIASEPYRLYRFVVPPSLIHARTLAFAGAYRSPSVSLISQAQALWITAFFTGSIDSLSHRPTLSKNSADAPVLGKDSVDSDERITYSAVLHSEFCKWRYSRGFGGRVPDLWFDSLPYVDLLLNDVGVAVRRKRGLWWREWLSPYAPGDYKGLVEEWLRLRTKAA